VCEGQDLILILDVMNSGEAPAVNDGVPTLPFVIGGNGGATVVSGPDPIMPATIAGGGHVAFTWTVTALTAGSVGFTTTVQGQDGNSGRLATTGPVSGGSTLILRAGALSAKGYMPPVVCVGQPFTIALSVTNVGGTAVLGVTATVFETPGGRVVVSAGPLPSNISGLAPGSATLFTWTAIATASGVVTFTFSVSGTTCGNLVALSVVAASATVQDATTLMATVAGSPSTVCVGQDFLVTVTVTNTGASGALGVLPWTITLGGSGRATLVSGPTPAVGVMLSPGAARTFTYTFTGTALGPVILTVTVSGFDTACGLEVHAGPLSGTVSVNPPGVLTASAAAPPFVSLGQWFRVALTASNTGGVELSGITATIFEAPGGNLVTREAGPVPSGPISIPSGASWTFLWTYSATGLGTVCFSATAAGVTCGGLASAEGSAAACSVIQTPAALSATLTASATAVCVGDAFLVVLDVSNPGRATAINVGADVGGSPFLGALAPGVSVIGPVPAFPAAIPGGGSMTFTWTVVGTVPGTNVLTTRVRGNDINSGLAVSTTLVSAGAVGVVSSGALVATVVLRPTVSIGQTFSMALSVTNTGGDSVRNVVPAISASPSGLVGPPSGPIPPAGLTLGAGAATTFVWTVSAPGPMTGGVCFTLTVAGNTCVSTTTLAMSTACTVVQTPANLVGGRLTVAPSPACAG
jgi:hypothetical protein